MDIQTSHVEEALKSFKNTSPARRKIFIIFSFRVVDGCDLSPNWERLYVIYNSSYSSKETSHTLFHLPKTKAVFSRKQHVEVEKAFQRNCCV